MEISYFEFGFDLFILNGDYIVDLLLLLVYSDFKCFFVVYDFIFVGCICIVDCFCDVICVVVCDGMCYSFIVWLDVEIKLLLCVDLFDCDGEMLEQFWVVFFNVGDNVSVSMEMLVKVNLLLQLLVFEGGDKVNFNWVLMWFLQGVIEVFSSQCCFFIFDGLVELCFYFDGLFSFLININCVMVVSSDQLLCIG